MNAVFRALSLGTPAALASLVLSAQVYAAADLLPSIPKGISIQLNPIATGLSAPDYAISAPGDPSRLFVVEQNGLLRVIQNGSLLAAPALGLQSRVAPPLNPANANDERGFLGLAFHPGFNTQGSAGFHTLYTYTSEPVAPGTLPTYGLPIANPSSPPALNYRNVVSEWKVNLSQGAQFRTQTIRVGPIMGGQTQNVLSMD